VPWRGLEPRRLSAPPPQDGVSTNFTTRAITAGSRGQGSGIRGYEGIGLRETSCPRLDP